MAVGCSYRKPAATSLSHVRLMLSLASRTSQWICDRWLASDSASSKAYSSNPLKSPRWCNALSALALAAPWNWDSIV